MPLRRVRRFDAQFKFKRSQKLLQSELGWVVFRIKRPLYRRRIHFHEVGIFFHSNFKKHSVRFEEAQTVFLDPHAIEFFDNETEVDEDRFIRIGLSRKPRVLLVVFCQTGDGITRIISARKATPEERSVYEEGI